MGANCPEDLWKLELIPDINSFILPPSFSKQHFLIKELIKIFMDVIPVFENPKSSFSIVLVQFL